MEPAATPVTTQEPGKNTTLIIAVIAVLVILCCCCIAFGTFAWLYGDAILEELSLRLAAIVA